MALKSWPETCFCFEAKLTDFLLDFSHPQPQAPHEKALAELRGGRDARAEGEILER